MTNKLLNNHDVVIKDGVKYIVDAVDNSGNAIGCGFMWLRTYDMSNADIGIYSGQIVGIINCISHEIYNVTNVEDFRERLTDPDHIAVLYHFYFKEVDNVLVRYWKKLVDLVKRKS